MEIKEIINGSFTANNSQILLKSCSPSGVLAIPRGNCFQGIRYEIKPSAVGGGVGALVCYTSLDGTNWSLVTSTTLNNTTLKVVKIGLDTASGVLPLGPMLKFTIESYDSGTYTFVVKVLLDY